MLCLIEVFIVLGMMISHALSILLDVTWSQINILTTGIISLNFLSLVLLRMTSRHQDYLLSRECQYLPQNSDNHRGTDYESLRDTEETANLQEDELVLNVNFSDADDKDVDESYCAVRYKRRRCILVCLALFVIRDFSFVHVFRKSIHCIFTELNDKPVTYEQCALLVTMLQLIVATSTVFMVDMYGKWKPLLISSLGMLLAAMGLGMIMFDIGNVIAAAQIRNVCIMTVLLVYVVSFAHGVGSLPWAMLFDAIDQKIRGFAVGFLISAHFLFLMIVEFTYVNEEQVYSEHSTTAYWLILICILQSSFVYFFCIDTKS